MLRQNLIERQKNICFFGRRHGKALSKTQAKLLQETFPKFAVNLDQISSLFCTEPNINKFHLEIGFGGGEYLLHHAKTKPDTGFIGVEPFVSTMVKLLKSIKNEPKEIKNIRLYNDDASLLLQKIPDNFLDGLDLFYPDPWPKKKHNKRRFINKENLGQIVRILKNGSIFRFASDIDSYIEWTLAHCSANKYLDSSLNDKAKWHKAYDNWLSTRYEEKALAEKRKPIYLTFIVRKSINSP